MHKGNATHSINRLWMRISYISQVLLPSPLGVLRVEIFRVLVGSLTGPLTLSDLLRARSMSSWHTFSSEATLREVRVMRILWIFCCGHHGVSLVRLQSANLKRRRVVNQMTKMEVYIAHGNRDGNTYGAFAEVLLGLLERHGDEFYIIVTC